MKDYPNRENEMPKVSPKEQMPSGRELVVVVFVAALMVSLMMFAMVTM